MLQINDLTITLKKDLRTILDHFTFTLNPGDHAVIIGEEGNGKSTLLKLIYQEALVESYTEYTGEIIKGNSRLGYLAQEMPPKDKEKTIYDYLFEHGAYDDLDAKEIAMVASQLRLPAEFLYSDQMIGTLSGGEKVKLQLARIFMCRPDVLLLDEPTNDIDIDTLEWLEGFINQCDLPILYVSHDETLIERTANVIIHLEQVRKKTVCRHTIAAVPYAEYMKKRSSQLFHQEQVARKEQAEHQKQMERWQQLYNKVDHQQSAISRGDPHGGRLLKKKMKAVKSTQRRLEKAGEQMTQIPDVEEAIFLDFEASALPASKEVLNLKLAELKLHEKRLTGPVRLRVVGREHVGIIGRNGVGKTTLLRIIAETLLARTDFKAAYMPQNCQDELDYRKTPIEILAPSGEKDDVTRARSYLGSTKYTHDEMEHAAGDLSGGQRAKLLFLKMILEKCDVLILDEPTRNFSPLSNPVIRKILREYSGAIISITHDRKYLDEVCDRVYRLTEEGLELVR